MEQSRILGSLRALLEISAEINSLKPLDLLLQLIVKKADFLFHESYSSIIIYDEAKEKWIQGVSSDPEHRYDIHRFVRPNGASHYIATTKKELIVEDTSNSEFGHHPFQLTGNIKSFIGVPIIHSTKFLGVLYVYSRQKRRFEEEDVDLLKIMADQSAVAINNNMLYKQLKEKSIRDELTGLYNYLYVKSVIERELERIKQGGRRSAGILIDIDNLSEINRGQGHGTGDMVIINTANLLQTMIRKVDIASRYGGDEFLLFMLDASEDTAFYSAKRFLNSLNNEPFIIDNKKVNVSVSIGIAEISTNSYDEFMNNLDNTLFEAKKRGKNRIVRLSEIS